MARSPEYTVPAGLEDHDLAGIKPCGHVSAALAVKFPPEQAYANATEKDVREFFASMAKTGRDAVWMPKGELEKALYEGFGCKCEETKQRHRLWQHLATHQGRRTRDLAERVGLDQSKVRDLLSGMAKVEQARASGGCWFRGATEPEYKPAKEAVHA